MRQKAAEILRQRDIFTPRCRQLLEEYEQQGGFNETQAQEFVQEATETFRWHQSATVDEETYRALHNEHRLIADVVCFLDAISTTWRHVRWILTGCSR